MMINQLVNTPIGQGRLQGPYHPPYQPSPYPLPDPDGGAGGEGGAVLVRLPINEQTREHLKQANCLTPRATQSGLWVFVESDLS